MGPEGHTSYETDRRYFNRFGEGYSPYTEADLQLILGNLVAIMAGQPYPRICEVGCADGQSSGELARLLGSERPARFIGLDIADQVLRQYPFHKLCGSAFEMPVPDCSLDLVCYAASLHHLAPFSRALEELVRVLAPGGLAYFLEPNMLHPQRRLFLNHPALYRLYRDANDTPVHPYKLQSDVRGVGLEVLGLRFVTIAFKAPGALQKLQNVLSAAPWPERLQPYVSPWFVLIARRIGPAVGVISMARSPLDRYRLPGPTVL